MQRLTMPRALALGAALAILALGDVGCRIIIMTDKPPGSPGGPGQPSPGGPGQPSTSPTASPSVSPTGSPVPSPAPTATPRSGAPPLGRFWATVSRVYGEANDPSNPSAFVTAVAIKSSDPTRPYVSMTANLANIPQTSTPNRGFLFERGKNLPFELKAGDRVKVVLTTKFSGPAQGTGDQYKAEGNWANLGEKEVVPDTASVPRTSEAAR